MTTYGVTGELEFVLQDDAKKGGKYRDELLADFVKPDLAKVELSIRPSTSTGISPKKGEIVTGGIVVERELEEHVYSRVLDAPTVLARRYRVTFRDPAAALWRQHFPCDLFTQKSSRRRRQGSPVRCLRHVRLGRDHEGGPARLLSAESGSWSELLPI